MFQLLAFASHCLKNHDKNEHIKLPEILLDGTDIVS